jgi:2-keto-4-pentenoate hydratase/2-oxohepta-3-ene-1,7-dioic acid hydratase in catechol pathway
MKLLSFAADGKDWFGALRDDGVVTLNDKIGQPSLRAALAAGALDNMRDIAQRAASDRKLNEIKFLPVIPQPHKILCAGINYRSHAAEMARELPKQPSMFIRFADTLVGHGGELIRPRVSDNFDFEGELALVIGKGGRHIAAERALEHVAGYTCFVDGSVRDYQKFSVTAGKNFPATGPLGPWLVTADEIPDPDNVPLAISVNGEVKQTSNTSRLIYDCRKLIEWGSTFYTFYPGDVLFTGTPEGVSPVKPGDTMVAKIDPIGEMTVAVRAHKIGG